MRCTHDDQESVWVCVQYDCVPRTERLWVCFFILCMVCALVCGRSPRYVIEYGGEKMGFICLDVTLDGCPS